MEFAILSPSYYVTTCSVGLKDGRVRDSAFSASSSWRTNHAPHQARLDYRQNSGSWSAGNVRSGEWIQVDLGTPTQVTGVVTQGRHSLSYPDWITRFKISFSTNGNSFRTVRTPSGNEIVFYGNRDTYSYVMNRFPEPITARYFRLIVEAWQRHPSTRMEFITC